MSEPTEARGRTPGEAAGASLVASLSRSLPGALAGALDGVRVGARLAAGAARANARERSGRAHPVASGRLTVDGCGAPLEVLRDRHGVPHVFAASEQDALFGQGLVHAQDRLFQMEALRRLAAGRLAEVVGARALPADPLPAPPRPRGAGAARRGRRGARGPRGPRGVRARRQRRPRDVAGAAARVRAARLPPRAVARLALDAGGAAAALHLRDELGHGAAGARSCCGCWARSAPPPPSRARARPPPAPGARPPARTRPAPWSGC